MAGPALFGYRVAVTLPDGALLNCGILAASASDARREQRIISEFRYDPAYLQDQRGFALDPYALPLQAATRHFPDGLPGVIEDALPDAWGRAILARDHNLPPTECHPAKLLGYLRNPLGALSFAPLGVSPRGAVAGNTIPQLAELENVGRNIEAWETRDLSREVIAAIRAGSSLGGARPKVLVEDGATAWIAKFPSRDDDFDVVRCEAICLDITEKAGIPVPPSRLVEVGDKPVLLVRRFDLNGAGRNHHASLKSLLESKNLPSNYVAIAEVVRDLSTAVAADVVRLFRWMLVNMTVGNIDDHLKNFSMIRSAAGWQLSPAYDITPAALANGGYGGRFHSINFTDRNTPPTPGELLPLAGKMGLTPHQARESIAAVRHAVAAGLPMLSDLLDNENRQRFTDLLRNNCGDFLPD